LEPHPIKYNPEIISNLKSNSFPVQVNQEAAIQIFASNNDARDHLLIVLNPFCPPCKKAFRDLEKLMVEARRDDLQVRIMFSVDTEKEENTDKLKVCQYAVHTYLHSNNKQSDMRSFLQKWYLDEDRSVSGFDGPEIPDSDLDDVNRVLLSQRAWIVSHKINFTPTIILNNIILPKGYSVEDVTYLL